MKFVPGDLVTVGTAKLSTGLEYVPSSIEVYRRAGSLCVEQFLVGSAAQVAKLNSWETALVLQVSQLEHYDTREPKVSAARILLPSGGIGWVHTKYLKGVK